MASKRAETVARSTPSASRRLAWLCRTVRDSYRRDNWQDQPHYVELWGEKGYGIRVRPFTKGELRNLHQSLEDERHRLGAALPTGRSSGRNPFRDYATASFFPIATTS
jgi:hypothetical protein